MLSPDQIRELNEAYARDFNAHDAAAIRSYYADVVNFTSSGNPDTITDPELIPGNIAPMFVAFPDLVVEFLDDFSEGLYNAHHWEMRGTHTGPLGAGAGAGAGAETVPPTGKSVALRGLTMMIFNDEGQIVDDHTYFDPTALNRQLGLA